MQTGMWAYPWDIIDNGPETAIEELVDIGVDSVYVAANYHTVEAFSSHNPKRKTVFAEPSAYYQPDGEYGDLAPRPSPKMDGDDWIAQIADAVSDSPLELNAWIVGCHNSKLGMEHPEFTLESPFGDSLAFGLCPSQPAVQEYLKALLTDLDQYPFADFMLETFHYFHGSGWGWHHDKFHTDIGDLGEFLLGLCFCDECQQHARDAGIEVETARERSKTMLRQLAEGDVSPDIDAAAWLDRNESVKAYSELRTETITDLYREFAAETDANLGAFVGMKGIENSWMHGLDLAALQDPLDYVTLVGYLPETDAVIGRYERTTDRVTGIPVRVGLLPGHPNVVSKDTAVDQITAVAEAGAPEATIYNYGLLPERNLDWVRAGVERIK